MSRMRPETLVIVSVALIACSVLVYVLVVWPSADLGMAICPEFGPRTVDPRCRPVWYWTLASGILLVAGLVTSGVAAAVALVQWRRRGPP